MLKTWEFGKIRIISAYTLHKYTHSFIRTDSIGEWSFWQLETGEIVAVETAEFFC